MLRVVTGGQTGADQAGLRAAKAAGIETGGWAPLGWETEEGPAPWLSEFGLSECENKGYPARTHRNARDSDGTLWFGSKDSSGYRATFSACRKLKKPFLIVQADVTTSADLLEWIRAKNIRILNVAGNRESKNPGIGREVFGFLSRVFAQLRESERR